MTNIDRYRVSSQSIHHEQNTLEIRLQQLSAEEKQIKTRLFQLNEQAVKNDDECKIWSLKRKFHISCDVKEKATASFECYFLSIGHDDGEDAQFINSDEIEDYCASIFHMTDIPVSQGCKELTDHIINATGVGFIHKNKFIQACVENCDFTKLMQERK
ncbi:unnamed protein product [Didymodactylos carnosus]|uniref:Uncharacterized protein n=1 Tax=Didymodactylos carnosus TaxID=1234261 RepID=A0A815PGG0_9BILA|nr:unnamed protein product [Didymodactylos carnosus]CAF1448556.1 unnamed protein product [Didymodactylos carnosus]CAF3916299.1 unnamed protein product [Didymodactylos carnosus]CAF4322622.1 unnamed protein product [Didymodactylos carnosus]